ncbi:Unknown protein [Striga hermonthica]|uniref:Uncharacterized protein n=1 Tax=Striga hermonthica TaxID=68872 RepID=A0A9N7MRB7_STRHE|nr:Unknown protein [Striga hermonthica]
MQILWNGAPSESFHPSRGVRQGDPISLYLFVLCIERLAHSIQSEASTVQVHTLKKVLASFCRHSGLKVSDAKTNIFFSKNVPLDKKQALSNLMGFTRVEDLGYYLGVPILHSRIKGQTYEKLIEKADARLSGWKAASLSMAGRVVLSQAVVSALPYYTMQSALLPNSISAGLEKRIRRIIWGGSEDKRKLSLVKWEEVYLPKALGGLGVKRQRVMNEALLMKIGWKFLTDQNSLWARIWKVKYGNILFEDMAGHRKPSSGII